MQLSRHTERMLRASIVALTLVIALPIVVRFVTGEEPLTPRSAGWLAAFLAFVGALAAAFSPRRSVMIGAFAVQSAAVPFLVALVDQGYSFAASLLAAVTGQLVVPLGRRAAAWWSLVQTVPVVVVFFLMWRPTAAIIFCVIYGALQLFAFLMTSVAAEEAALRGNLAAVNAELRATRQLVAENSRSEERLRIARELHDLAGHHLTALTLNLESAKHRLPADARSDVEAALQTSRQLLNDIRTEVSAMRDLTGVRLDRALQTLADSPVRPRIVLDLTEEVTVADANHAVELLRCVQEIATNAARHGGATTLRIWVTHGDRGLEIVAHDDGRGSRGVTEGNGLRGMRERLAAFGGALEYESPHDGGFVVRLIVPHQA